MKTVFLLFPLGVLSAPSVLTPPTYDPSKPVTLFTDPSCTISKTLTPGQPLSFLFPAADALGLIFGPALTATIGPDNVEAIDIVADEICINAQMDPAGGNGICQNTFQMILDLANAVAPATKAAKYKCLLNLLCVAPRGAPVQGTCNILLAGADCIANRMVGVGDKECD